MAGNGPQSRDGGTFPGQAGVQGEGGIPAPPHLGFLQSFQDPPLAGMWHCDLTLSGQPPRQSDDADCHIPM